MNPYRHKNLLVTKTSKFLSLTFRQKFCACFAQLIISQVLSNHMGAEEFACFSRRHWAIENSLHWVLDDALREDRCTARKGHATENLGLMRKIVCNLLKLSSPKLPMWAAEAAHIGV
jgi:predicted transposase YbfD/YdcC